MGSFLKKIFLPTEQVKDIGKAVKGKKKEEPPAPAPEAKADTAEIATLKDEIAQLKSMILALQTPSSAISSSSYNLDAQRRAMGISPGIAEPAFRISSR